ncbi:hypothetical protein L195_g042662 [Trifolium pratense]|uniref:Uncharacterized protein n=1 Tax=Trifolium pratense TaxID=57577 RepID=A0A2K3M743_TRIPR|nr:hypothetical protein L195_g042662 [Trifolium pratense]
MKAVEFVATAPSAIVPLTMSFNIAIRLEVNHSPWI